MNAVNSTENEAAMTLNPTLGTDLRLVVEVPGIPKLKTSLKTPILNFYLIHGNISNPFCRTFTITSKLTTSPIFNSISSNTSTSSSKVGRFEGISFQQLSIRAYLKIYKEKHS